MNQEEFKKLNQAAQLIKAKEYDKARQLLKTMNNPKAKEWLAKISQTATQSPLPTSLSKAPPPPPATSPRKAKALQPEPLLPDTYEFKPRDFTPKPKLKPSRISSGFVFLIVSILISVGAVGLIFKDIMDKRQALYDEAVYNAPVARNHLATFCISNFSYAGYSLDQCYFYADKILEDDIYLATDIVECGRTSGQRSLCGGIRFPEEILGF